MARDPLDERIDELWPDAAPWRLPATPTAPSTGDPALDSDLAKLDNTPQNFLVLSEAQARLIARGSPAVTGAAIDWLDAFVAQPLPRPVAPFDARLVAHFPAELQRHAISRAGEATTELYRRASIVNALSVIATAHLDLHSSERLFAVLERPQHDGGYRQAVGHALLAAALRDPGRWPAVLERFAKHVSAQDRLLPWAAAALARLDEDAALARMQEVMSAVTDSYLRTCTAVALSKVVDLDARPAWVDVLCQDVLGVPLAIEVSYPFMTVKTAAPLLRALPYAREEPYFADLLSNLRRVDDPGSAAALESFAESLPQAAKGAKLARSKQSVATLVKRLRRNREVVDGSSFELRPGVGTDGGPIVVLPASLATSWSGAGEAYGQEGAPEDDYQRACAASDGGGVGTVKCGRGAGIVLPLQSAEIATIVDGKKGSTLVFLLMGTDVMLEMAMKQRGAWKKTKHVLALDDDAGITLLDAAWTIARADDEQKKDEPLARGIYAVEELLAEGVHAVRLVPKPTKRSG